MRTAGDPDDDGRPRVIVSTLASVVLPIQGALGELLASVISP